VFRERLRQEQPDLFGQVPAQVWNRPWNVGAQPAGSGEHALRYLARYVFKTATANREVQRLPDGRVRWPYRDSQTGREPAIHLAPLDWMSRFLQHILPRHFARVRTFGWLHPAAKVRGNRVRALLRERPVLTPAEQTAWQPPGDADAESEPAEATTPAAPAGSARCAAPLCPRCQQAMRRVGSWKPGQPMLFPNRPPCARAPARCDPRPTRAPARGDGLYRAAAQPGAEEGRRRKPRDRVATRATGPGGGTVA
jgi:hypothetical protein